jgi:hypothetical protein
MRSRPPRQPKKKLERETEAQCRKHAETLGFRLLKFVSPGAPGMTDRILLPPSGGCVVFVEFKRPGERPTPLQEAWHKDLRRRGFLVWVIHSFDIFKANCAGLYTLARATTA